MIVHSLTGCARKQRLK